MKTIFDHIPKVDLEEIFYNTNKGEFSVFTDIAFEKHLKNLHNITVSTKEHNPNLPDNEIRRLILIHSGFWYKGFTGYKV